MTMPTFQEIMRPLLNHLSDNKEHILADLVVSLAKYFNLTDMEKSQLLPSGKQGMFANRVGWAKTYLARAGLVSTMSRGIYKITPIGTKEIKNPTQSISVKYLRSEYRRNLKFINFINGNKNQLEQSVNQSESNPESHITDPIETIENQFTQLNQQLAIDLLDKIKSNPPQFFENLVADLLIKMGYGSSKQDILKNSGHSGDGGIDGIIKEDLLGFSKIYIQAKRWMNAVGSKEIRDFVGALRMQNASKGLFVTTSTYTEPAKKAC